MKILKIFYVNIFIFLMYLTSGSRILFGEYGFEVIGNNGFHYPRTCSLITDETGILTSDSSVYLICMDLNFYFPRIFGKFVDNLRVEMKDFYFGKININNFLSIESSQIQEMIKCESLTDLEKQIKIIPLRFQQKIPKETESYLDKASGNNMPIDLWEIIESTKLNDSYTIELEVNFLDIKFMLFTKSEMTNSRRLVKKYKAPFRRKAIEFDYNYEVNVRNKNNRLKKFHNINISSQDVVNELFEELKDFHDNNNIENTKIFKVPKRKKMKRVLDSVEKNLNISDAFFRTKKEIGFKKNRRNSCFRGFCVGRSSFSVNRVKKD